MSACSVALATDAFSEFAYRDIQVQLLDAKGHAVAHAAVYGFCRELNLICPRRDEEPKGHNDVLWRDSFLGKTGEDAIARMQIAPGKWRFFAVGLSDDGTVVAGWSDAKERSADEIVRLSTGSAKQWSLRGRDGSELRPRRLVLKPRGFPIWIPISFGSMQETVSMSMSDGVVDLFAEGDPGESQPGFALSFGGVSEKTVSGKLTSTDVPAVIRCAGGGDKAVLSWIAAGQFALRGDIALAPTGSKVLISPGERVLAYRRAIGGEGWMAKFIGQRYSLSKGKTIDLKLDGPLKGTLEQRLLPADDQRPARMLAQLNLIDANGHLLGQLVDEKGSPVRIGAQSTINGKQFQANADDKKAKAARKSNKRNQEEDDEDPESEDDVLAPYWGQTLFRIQPLDDSASVDGAVWDFNLPPSVMTSSHLLSSPRVAFTSATFRIEQPEALIRTVNNLLPQLEALSHAMDEISGHVRTHAMTEVHISIRPGGAAAAHDGTGISIGPHLFYYDQPTLAHTIVHELGHNYGFHHGGLHETVVEVCRCAGGEQISQQPAKWFFLDRMNGLDRKETGRPNVGLYLWCYAKAGAPFVHFLARNELNVLVKLGEKYSEDELRCVLLSVAMGRDMTEICRRYGLTIRADHLGGAIRDVKRLCNERSG